MPTLIDTHAHLDLEQFAADRDDVVRQSLEAGVIATICPGITAESSRAALALAERHESIHAAVGIHPNSTAEVKEGDWEAIVAMADDPSIVALGETGLDNYWDYAPIELQRDYFRQHLALGAERDLPVIIHCREAEDDLLPILREMVPSLGVRAVIHSFSGDRAFAEACLDLGLHISFAGAVTYTNKKFAPLWDAATVVPDDRLMVETDAPFLTPHPLRGRRKRNEPQLIRHTVERLAALRGQSPDKVAELTTANAKRFFGLG